MATAELPSAMTHLDEIVGRIGGRRPALFLDFDGTLAPIVARPEQAALVEGVAPVLRALAGRIALAVVSGRGLDDVRGRVALDGVAYAGSHGFEIRDENGRLIEHEAAKALLPTLDAAEADLVRDLAGIDGAIVERKRFAIAVHYRLVADDDVAAVEAAVDRALAGQAGLARSGGKKIFELRPAIDWHKGKAVDWLMRALEDDPARVFPIYIGDDVTDEDAFATIRDSGVGILVGPPDQPTAARYCLDSPDAVGRFLDALRRRLI